MKQTLRKVLILGLGLVGLLATYVWWATRWQSEEYVVYDLIIRARVAESETIFVGDRTEPYRWGWLFVVPAALLSWDAEGDFVLKNSSSHRLEDRFRTGSKRVFVSVNDFERKGGLSWFYEQHPAAGGFLIFKRVGFNPSRTRAKVYVEYFCGLCGWGTTFYLEKKNGVWVIAEEKGHWSS